MRPMPRRRRSSLLPLVFVLAAAGSACGGAGGPSVVGGGGGIPNFEFGFQNQANVQHRFFLFPDTDNAASGSFVEPSNERLSDTAAPSSITGTFTNLTMNLTIHRSAGNVAVTGRFVTTNRLELRFPGGVIVLADRIQP